MDQQIQNLLRDKIEGHRLSVEQLERELEAERTAMEKYRAALAVIEELPHFPLPASSSGHLSVASPAAMATSQPSGGFPQSIKYGALEVLRRNGGAMALTEIAAEMLRAGFEYENGVSQLRTTIGVTLERWRNKGITEKVAVATYRLSPRGFADANKLIAQNMGKA